jgi:hypothetical protein
MSQKPVKKVLAHTCFQHKKGFVKDTPLSPNKCRCRAYITAEEAASEVALGLAQYVIVVDKIIEIEDTCDICGAVDILKKTCLNCNHTGVVKHKIPVVVRGHDIVRAISPDGKRNLKTTQVKKSPTIEKAHIERAYVNDNRAEQIRIEEYGILTKECLFSLISGYEPVDDFRKGIGRKHDWGRSLYGL